MGKLDQTFLGGAFQRLAGVEDWEEMFGGRNTAGKICQVCLQAVECASMEKRCWGKTMIGVMASATITQGPIFQITFADLLREAIDQMAKSKERIKAAERASLQAAEGSPCAP